MKLWKDMTPEEKGALLLAYHEGKVIEFLSRMTGKWGKPAPKPVVKEVVMYGKVGEANNSSNYFWNGCDKQDTDTHKITFNIVEGVPDCNSIRMEKL